MQDSGASEPSDASPVISQSTTDQATDAIGRRALEPTQWEAIAQSKDFSELLQAKTRFIVPATLFFVSYYFALPILVGYRPELLRSRVFGVVNGAYLFAVSQFFMAWFIAGLYVVVAARWDRKAMGVVSSSQTKVNRP